jgi:hypothetical protein
MTAIKINGMARSNGLFGEFSGKIGNLVSYQLRGKTVVRRIGKSNKPPTLAQLAVRQRVAIVTKFLRSALPVINVGFEFEVAGTTKHQHNAAVSVNVKCATQGEYPNINLDYSKVVVSMGALAPAVAPTAVLTGSLLTLTWAADADMDWGFKNDRALLLVYCPELDKAVYVLSGARRSTGHNEIELPVNFVGKELHCYVAFKSSDGKMVSDSVWIQY